MFGGSEDLVPWYALLARDMVTHFMGGGVNFVQVLFVVLLTFSQIRARKPEQCSVPLEVT